MAEAGKFKPPPPMVTPVEKRSSNKFCDFHNDKGHNTDECMQLKKQIEELVRAGKLSHLIKEIKQGKDQPKVGKKEVPTKDNEITFPPLKTSSGTEGLLVIEAEIGGHMIHRMKWQSEGVSGKDEHKYVAPEGKTWIYSHSSRPTTIRSTILIPAECATVTTSSKEILKEAEVHHEKYAVVLHADFPDQVEAGIMSKVYYHDWLSNPIMVKKHDGSWRMCVDFTDLNKACYHQIQMAESDEEKTAFHTGHGVYCYTKMLFGLKNAGATYQRLVDKAFDNQVGRNIKVYVDDLVIKSHTETEMLRDIDEAFRTLRKINMKLNPKKCTFEAVEGTFLGYMISPKGIKPCLDKTEAVLRLLSPRTIKEVQSLNGKLASLNRFLSKSTEKSLPLFKTLKKCIKKSDFHWTPKAEQAIKQLKQHLLELPMLVAPNTQTKGRIDCILVRLPRSY
ncbi:reverse transcriptase domain-containing protein [Tanacetum coccineum]